MTLAIHEALLLFGLDRQTGAWHSSRLDMGIASAVLSDLVLLGAVDCDSEGLLQLLAGGQQLESEVLQSCLGRLAQAGSVRVEDWVRSLTGSGLTQAVAEELCRRKILVERKVRFLLIFPHSFYEELDGGPEREMRQRIERELNSPSGGPEPFVHMLLSVADATGLLPFILDPERLVESGYEQRVSEPDGSGEEVSRSDELAERVLRTTLAMDDERKEEALMRAKTAMYGAGGF